MTTLVCKQLLGAVLKDGGRIVARFSTDAVDTVGDVVLPTAFTDGQQVPLAAFGHRWDRLPVGKGVVRVEPHGARFEGTFFDHPEAQATRDTLAALGDLAAWSFGFTIEQAHSAVVDQQPVRVVDKLALHEVSGVLVPANPYGTGTLSLRQDTAAQREVRALYAQFRRQQAALLQQDIARLEGELRARDGTAVYREFQAITRRLPAALRRVS